MTTGALPAGLTLSTAGVLSGLPPLTGGFTFTFTVTATDAAGCLGSRLYTLTVSCPTITIAPVTLSAGTIGVAYSQTITASGGTAPYTFGVTSGALPPGLALSSAGLLSGTPTTEGTFTFTITATDSAGCQASRTYTLGFAIPTYAIPTLDSLGLGILILALAAVGVLAVKRFSM